jgi:uncharacterized protein (DUF486 family)
MPTLRGLDWLNYHATALVAIQILDGIGASLSQAIAGGVVHHFGSRSGFLFLSAVAGSIGRSIFLYAGDARTTRAKRKSMKTIILLFCSNVFMTFAWYGHLKYGHAWPLWKAILVSWLIALLEYCLAVPANRWGFGTFTGFQLKIIQEAITVAVFIVFAITFLKERMAWNYAVSFALLIAAVVVAFAFRSSPAIGG